jgi:cytochrome c
MSRFPDTLLAVLVAVFVLGTSPAGAAGLGVGRTPLPAEIAAWDIDVRPDGKGLPKGRGTVREGEVIYQERCATCHGEFGEGAGRWPELAGGAGSLTAERPLKTVGSYFAHVSTVFDFVRRAMPFGNAQSLTPDETFAVVAYVLSLNDVVTDEAFELNERNLATLHLPNENGFYDDDRLVAERSFWTTPACMTDCKTEVHITGHAAVLDVTPDAKAAPKLE